MLELLQMTAVVLATLSAYGYRADFAKYSIFTAGVFKRLDRRVVSPPSFECAECEGHSETAEKRIYYKEIVLAGMPVLRYDKAHSFYCADHVSFESLRSLDNPQPSRIERLSTPIIEAVAAFAGWKYDTVVETEESEFSAVTNSVGNAFNLLPIVLLVLAAATVMGLISRLEN